MDKYIKFIGEKLTERELLETLAEEASEVSHASLKLIRAKHYSKNYTPTSKKIAVSNLDEEVVDLLVCLYALGFDLDSLFAAAMASPKIIRWAKRLGHREG